MAGIPPPPPGFELEGGIPPPPAGFELQSSPEKAVMPPPPSGFEMEAPRAGILDYLTEAGKQFGIGAVESAVATPLRGVSQPEPGMSEMAAIAGLPQPPRPEAVDLRTLPTYQWGEKVSKAIGADQPSPLYSGLPLDVIRGFGSVAGSILTGGVTGGLAQSGEAAQRAVQKGATPEQQRTAQQTGGLAGPTELADMLLLSTGSAGKALSAISRIGLKALRGAAIEGGQEGVQQVIQNAISRGVYDPNQSLGEGVPHSMLVGAIVGGGVGAVMPGERPAEQPQQTIEGAAPPAQEADPLAAAYGATVEPIAQPAPLMLPPPASPPEPEVVGIDVSGAKVMAPGPSPAATVEAVKEMGTPPTEAPAPPPVEEGLYKGTFTPKEVQTNLTRNLQRLMNYNLALADPEVQRNPDQIRRIEEQIPILRSEIIAQRQFLGQTAPAEPQPQVLLPPPAITPTEVAAGLEPPPRPMLPAPVVVGVPEEVNIAAARVVEAPPILRPEPTLDTILDRPLDLTDEQVQTAAGNFGLLRYALYDVEAERTHVTSAFNISPGQKPTGERLRVPQDEISPRNIIIHSNSAVNPVGGPLTPDGPRVDMVEAGVAKFGQRFHDYALQMGEQFRALRDVVAGIPGPTVPTFGGERDYSGLLSEGIGVSFDPRYHGVSIKVPVSVTFLNIGMPKYIDPFAAAEGFYNTMIHELSHHTHRSEHKLEDIMAEMIDHLAAHPTFDLGLWQRGLVDTVTRHQDVMNWMRGLYADGNVEAIGRSLPIGTGQAPSRSGSVDVGGLTDRAGRGWGSTLSDWAKISPQGASGVTDPRRGGAKTSGVGGYRGKPDFGRGQNQRAVNREVGHSGVPAVQQTPETQSTRQAIRAAFNGDMPEAVAAQAAHADHINWLYKWGGSLLDLAQRNLRFTPLVRYTELARQWHMLEARVQDAGVTIAKRWRSLGTEQSDALTNLFDDLTNMLYLTPTEKAAGVVRNPTQQEFNAIANRYKVGPEGLRVYTDVRRFFTTFLRLTADNAKDAARRTISDPNELGKALTEVDQWVTTLEKRPYFPFLRFGSHYIHAKDANGHTVFFGLYERKGVLSARQVQLNMKEQIRRQFPTAMIDDGVMPEDVRPFYGMPPSLLKMIHQKMNLTSAQIDAIEQLQFQMSPEMSFRHRFQHKSYTPGYSRDFIRAFSHYAFHGARYYAKTKHVWDMEDQIKLARAVGGDKATRIANFMEDHLQNTMLNIQGDYGLLKGIAFNWHLAFMPSSAFVNMTQTPMVTGPFLAAKFGNTRAIRTMLDVMRKLNNYYRKGTYQGQTEFELRALGVGMLWGVVSETQASELAALGNGNGLILGVGGTKAQQAMQWFQQKGALMFETAEQFNRRIAFRSALKLAMNDQTNKYVDEAVLKNPTMYNDLINGVNTAKNGKFTPQEARAIVAAFDAVEQTQFVYSRFARPRFMRGKFPGALTVFYRFTQGVIFLFLNENRSYRARYLLMAALFGGLSGLAGYDELKDLFEGVMKRFFGKHINVDSEIRKYVKQFTGTPEAADYILHGWARRGFNVAHALDAMGSLATGRPGRGLLDPPHMGYSNVPFPQLDMSKAVTLQLSPIQVGKLLTPFQDPNKIIAEQSTRAAGATFSIPINIYKALMSTKEELGDTKRWEKAVPRAVAGVSKTFRTFSEGRERFGGRPESARTLVKYDVRDPEQAMEVIFKGMGFNPLRESREWDFMRASLEHKQFVEGTRKLLMEQMFEAIRGRDPKEIESVKEDMRKFNERVRGTSDRGYVITEKGLEQSMRTRARELGLAEAGLSGRKREIPNIQELREIYPRAVEIQRR